MKEIIMKVKKETLICPKCGKEYENLAVISYSSGIKSMAESAQKIAQQQITNCDCGEKLVEKQLHNNSLNIEIVKEELKKANTPLYQAKNGDWYYRTNPLGENAYCIKRIKHESQKYEYSWLVYFRGERGMEVDKNEYFTESDACADFLRRVGVKYIAPPK